MDRSLDQIIEETISIYISSAHSAAQLGNRKLSKKLYRRAVTLVRKTADSNGFLISILIGLSSVYLAERRPRKAELLIQRAQQLMKSANSENADLFCNIHLALAECYVMQQRFELSHEHVEHVLKYFNTVRFSDNPYLAPRLTAVGQAYFRENRLQEASDIIKQLHRLQN